MKYLIIVGVALAVVLLAKKAGASDAYNPKNWDYVPDYVPGSGLIL